MSSHDHSHHHGHEHAHHHGHAHAHGAASPHPPMVVPPSFMRLSIASRLAIALLASAVMWCAVLLAMRS